MTSCHWISRCLKTCCLSISGWFHCAQGTHFCVIVLILNLLRWIVLSSRISCASWIGWVGGLGGEKNVCSRCCGASEMPFDPDGPCRDSSLSHPCWFSVRWFCQWRTKVLQLEPRACQFPQHPQKRIWFRYSACPPGLLSLLSLRSVYLVFVILFPLRSILSAVKIVVLYFFR